jgi:hypothetical protein
MKKYILLSLILLEFSFYSVKAQEVEKKQKLEFSFSERIRLTAFDNAISLNDDSDPWAFSRYKTNLGVSYLPNKNIEVKLQFGNEARIWISPDSKKSKFGEIFVDQLYFKWNNVAKLPLELTIGRQNLIMDEGFICLDGQPLTGSRSIYFNAVKAVYSINERNNITAFISYIPQSDNLLPIINKGDSPVLLEEQTNTGASLYYKTKIKNSKLSAYYFYKTTYENIDWPIESQINTFGARLEQPLVKDLAITTEAAYQFGKSGEFDRSAFGGYFHLDYSVKGKIPIVKSLSFGGFYLSGDDPKTEKNEGWDPLWSRWPKWSESYIYTLIIENKGKVAYWSNISSLNFTVNGTFSEKMSFQGSYYHLWALEDNTTAFCDGSGKTRGDLFTLQLKYKIDKNWSGHILWENFTPGNFYPSTADGYNWIRFELKVKI